LPYPHGNSGRQRVQWIIVSFQAVGCFMTGTYGAAVTFVCGDGEKQTLEQFADVCHMCISPLPG